MAVTAPTPPVPPTPPTSPAASSNTNAGSDAAITPPNADFVGAVKQAESIGTAIFGPGKSAPSTNNAGQGQSSQSSAAGTASAAQGAQNAAANKQAKTSSQANNPAQLPAAATGQTEEQTTQPPAADTTNGNASPHSMVYWPFAALVIIIGAGLFCRHLFKKTTPPLPEQNAANISAKTLPPKKADQKSHFEVRI